MIRKILSSILTAALILAAPGPGAFAQTATMSRGVPMEVPGAAGNPTVPGASDAGPVAAFDLSTQIGSTALDVPVGPNAGLPAAQIAPQDAAHAPSFAHGIGPAASAAVDEPRLPTEAASPARSPEQGLSGGAGNPAAPVAPRFQSAAAEVEAAKNSAPALAQFHAGPQLDAAPESRRLFDEGGRAGISAATVAPSPAGTLVSRVKPALTGLLAAAGTLALGVVPALADTRAPAPEAAPQAPAAVDSTTFWLYIAATAVLSPILVFLARRYGPRLREWVSAKWSGIRDPLLRALRRSERANSAALSAVNEHGGQPVNRVGLIIGMMLPLAEALGNMYDIVRRYLGQNLKSADIPALSRLKRLAAELYRSLPGSQQEFDMMEWFGSISPGDIKQQNRRVAPHFPSLIYKAVQGTVAKNYRVERVVSYDDMGNQHPPATQAVEVGNDKEEELVVSGVYFLEKDGHRLVVVLGNGSVTVAAPRKDWDAGKEFFGLMEDWISENHIYRGQRLGFEDGEFYFLSGIRDNLTWQDYIVDPKTRADIQFFTTNWLDRLERLKSAGGPAAKNLKSGLFLWGPRGTGKTLLSHVLLSVTKGRSTFVNLSAADFNGPGDIRALFAGARELGTARQPIILNFNEFDTMGAVKRNSGTTNQFLGELLEQMDGIHGNQGLLVIGTSNLSPRKMDRALFRPGRFTYQLRIPLPDQGVRKGLLEFYFKSLPRVPFDLARFAEARYTEGFVPADFDELARLAYRIADLDPRNDEGAEVRVQAEHVEKAIEMMRFTRGAEAEPAPAKP